MRSRFFTLAVSSFCLAVATTFAQAPAASPAKVGYLRFWNMLPATGGNYQVVEGKAGDTPLASATSYRYSSYTQIPVGRHRLSVIKAGNPTPAKIFDVDVKPDTYFTVLISPKSIDMFDDTIDPAHPSGIITIRNFFPGVSIAVSSGQQTLVPALGYGQSFSATGLPLGMNSFALHTKLPDGKPAEGGADIDLKTAHHATLLVIPDSYGRFRVRSTPDGVNL